MCVVVGNTHLISALNSERYIRSPKFYILENEQILSIFHLLRLRSDGSRLEELLDIIAAIEKSVAFFDAAAAAAAAAAEAEAFRVLQ